VGSDGNALRNWLIIIAVVLVWYSIVCALFPYRTCGHCAGGKTKTSQGKTFRICWWCGGFGGKPRLGTRVYRRVRHKR
jgi:hypothetical protein